MKIFIVLIIDSQCGCEDGDCCGYTSTSIAHILDKMAHSHTDRKEIRKAKTHLKKHNKVDFNYSGSLKIEEVECK